MGIYIKKYNIVVDFKKGIITYPQMKFIKGDNISTQLNFTFVGDVVIPANIKMIFQKPLLETQTEPISVEIALNVVEKVATYEIPNSILDTIGSAKISLTYINGDIIYTLPIFIENIEIENNLGQGIAPTEQDLLIVDQLISEVNGKMDEWLQIEADISEVEALRVIAENSRVSVEKTRVSQEETRIENEETRIENEDTRVGQEETRIENEETRIENEDTRIENEDTRIEAEKTRVGQENARIENEETRIENEETRIENEETRVENEDTRIENEETRVENEETRVGQENARIENEETRVENEDTRIENEDTRIENEETRIENEETRIENEETRVGQEIERQKNTAIAISNCEEATNTANGTSEQILEDKQNGLFDAAELVSGAFVGDDLVFTKSDNTTITFTNARLLLKGEGFNFATKYISVAQMFASNGFTNEGVALINGDFVYIDTGNNEDLDDAKWYQWNGVTFIYKGDLSGLQGITGVGIADISKTSTNELIDTYTITLTNGSTTTFTVTNGEKGDTGASIVSAEFNNNDIKFIKDDESTVTLENAKTILTGPQGVKGDVNFVSFDINLTTGQLVLTTPTDYASEVDFEIIDSNLYAIMGV